MKTSLLLVALCAAPFVPAFGAPDAAPKTPVKPVAKPVADPLDIPAFAPIPTEFVFAGMQNDVYKLLKGYTGGISLAELPEPTTQEWVELQKGKDSQDGANFAALLELKHLLAPIHVVRVRSVSYYALGEEAQDKAMEALGEKVEKDDEYAGKSPLNRGYDRSLKLLEDAETFYKEMLAKQGGKIQMQLRGETSISVYAFESPQTFAVVTRGPSRVIVARADGKPDVGAITGIFGRVVGNN